MLRITRAGCAVNFSMPPTWTIFDAAIKYRLTREKESAGGAGAPRQRKIRFLLLKIRSVCSLYRKIHALIIRYSVFFFPPCNLWFLRVFDCEACANSVIESKSIDERTANGDRINQSSTVETDSAINSISRISTGPCVHSGATAGETATANRL